MTTKMTVSGGRDTVSDGGDTVSPPDGPEYYNGIHYPSADGEPLAENDFQAMAMTYLFGALRGWFRNRADIYVMMDMLTYYVEGDPQRSFAPDIAVMFGANGNHPRYSWMVWRENGVLPGVIIEVASQNTWRADAGYKRDLYARLGVGEYWRHDPTGEYFFPTLIGERLVNGRYEPIELSGDESGGLRGHSEALGLDLRVLRDREPNLRLYDPATGEWLRSLEEERQARLAAEAARDEAEAEIRRLREMLGEAGRI